MPTKAIPGGRAPRPRKAPPAVDLDALVPQLAGRARAAGVLKAPEIKKAGVPAAQLGEALRRLAGEGLEPCKAGVRVPLEDQIAGALEARRMVRLADLARLVVGATAKECAAMAAALAEDGQAVLLVRGTAEVLAVTDVAALPRARLEALARAAKQLASLALRARKRPHRTLLLDDLREQLGDLLPAAASPGRAPVEGPPAATRPSPLRDDEVHAAVRRSVRPDQGMAFVPDVVRALAGAPLAAIHRALRSLSRDGLVELRPESGLGLYSDEEMALCPPGPQGTRLSWARLLGEAP